MPTVQSVYSVCGAQHKVFKEEPVNYSSCHKALNQYHTEVRVVTLEAGVGTPLQPEEYHNNQDEQAGLPQINFDVPLYLQDVKHLHKMHSSKAMPSLNCKQPKDASRAQSSCIVTFIHERKAKKGLQFFEKQCQCCEGASVCPARFQVPPAAPFFSANLKVPVSGFTSTITSSTSNFLTISLKTFHEVSET
jgi:hypothetical protein